MIRTRTLIVSAALFAAASVGALAVAAQNPPAQTPPNQTPPAGAQPGRGRGGEAAWGGFANAFPQHPPGDPAVVERGKAIYGVNCKFCHGSDARGGEGGPNLLRSELVLNDKNGELIAPVVQNGRPDQGMPKIDLTAAQVSDIAAYIHSFRVGGYDVSRDASAQHPGGRRQGRRRLLPAEVRLVPFGYRRLKGIGAQVCRSEDAAAELADARRRPWRRGGRGGGTPVTVTVTLAVRAKVAGRLVRIDDFISLTDADGTQRTFRRDGDGPRWRSHDPLEPHRELLPIYTDKDIHNVTAYLVTLK